MDLANNWKDYEIIDMANGEKLERWKDIILVRPDPQIIWKDKSFPKKWKDMLEGDVKPCGDDSVVFVTKGGSFKDVKASDLTDVVFMNGATNVSEIVQVVEAKNEKGAESEF